LHSARRNQASRNPIAIPAWVELRDGAAPYLEATGALQGPRVHGLPACVSSQSEALHSKQLRDASPVRVGVTFAASCGGELTGCRRLANPAIVSPTNVSGGFISRRRARLSSLRQAPFTIKTSLASAGLRHTVAGSHRMEPQSCHREQLIGCAWKQAHRLKALRGEMVSQVSSGGCPTRGGLESGFIKRSQRG
jgi:hypothetical protein